MSGAGKKMVRVAGAVTQWLLVAILVLRLEPGLAKSYVFCTQQLPPFSWVRDGEVVGIAPQILRTLANRLGWSYQIELLPWKRAQLRARDGTCDLIFPLLKKPEREAWLLYAADPFMQLEQTFYVLADSTLSFDGDLQAFVGDPATKFGVEPEHAYSPDFDRLWHAGGSAKFVEATSLDAAVKMLLARRFDVFVKSRIIADYQFKRMGVADKVRALNPPFYSAPFYFAFSRAGKLVDQAGRFDDALRDLQRTGRIAAIAAQYR